MPSHTLLSELVKHLPFNTILFYILQKNIAQNRFCLSCIKCNSYTLFCSPINQKKFFLPKNTIDILRCIFSSQHKIQYTAEDTIQLEMVHKIQKAYENVSPNTWCFITQNTNSCWKCCTLHMYHFVAQNNIVVQNRISQFLLANGCFPTKCFLS